MDAKEELTKYLHLIIKVGVGVLTAIFTGFGVGLYIDKTLALGGIGILGGVIVGVMVGFIWIFKEVMSIGRQESE